MKKKCIYIFVIGLVMAVLTACSNTQESVPETYGINPASMGDNSMKQDIPDSEYEIDDMLPRPSDDTLIISVEEAEAINSRNANKNAGNNEEQDIPDSEYEIDDMLPELSEDTYIMTVEEAEAFMNRRANIYGDIDEATDMESPDTVK